MTTPTRVPDRGHEGLEDFVILGAAVVLLLLVVGIAVFHPEPLPVQQVMPPTSSDVTVVQPGPDGAPIFTYDAKDQRLVIGEHAPRALLLCLHDRCDLVEAWRQR